MAIEQARLWQLVSPTLPVGAFGYSQGLETAVAEGLLAGEAETRDWIAGLLERSVTRVDLALLARLLRARRRGNRADFAAWNEQLLAMRETRELREQELACGAALARLLGELGIEGPGLAEPSLVAAFACAAEHWRLPAEQACAGYAWSWCDAQVAAAVKLVPLGHSAGQRLLLGLGEAVHPAAHRALALADDEIGFSTHGLAMLCARHETQYTRLFRS